MAGSATASAMAPGSAFHMPDVRAFMRDGLSAMIQAIAPSLMVRNAGAVVEADMRWAFNRELLDRSRFSSPRPGSQQLRKSNALLLFCGVMNDALPIFPNCDGKLETC
jgi:hypothetical protein